MGVVDVLAYVAAVLLVAMSVPQTIRSYRHGSQGVSTTTWIMVAAAVSLWIGYGIAHGVLVLILANIAALIGACATIVVLNVAKGKSWPRSIAQVSIGAALALVVAVLAPLPLVTAGAIILPILSRAPQVWACVRSYLRSERTEVAHATWMLSMAGQGLWLVYGLAYGDGALIAVNAVCVAMTVVLLIADTANAANRRRDTQIVDTGILAPGAEPVSRLVATSLRSAR